MAKIVIQMISEKAFDRTREDVSNIVHLEHVNVTQPDQGLATQFYVAGLGGTRDPFMLSISTIMNSEK